MALFLRTTSSDVTICASGSELQQSCVQVPELPALSCQRHGTYDHLTVNARLGDVHADVCHAQLQQVLSGIFHPNFASSAIWMERSYMHQERK